MLVRWIDAPGLPQHANSFKERVKHLEHCIFKSVFNDRLIQQFLEPGFIQFDHGDDQVLNLAVVPIGNHRNFQYLFGNLAAIETGKFGDLIAMIQQDSDIHQLFHIMVTIIADIGVGPLWLHDAIPLFPDTDGMCFYAAYSLKIFNAIVRHGMMNTSG